MVPHLAVRANGKAGQRDEVVNVGNATTRATRGRHPRIVGVRVPASNRSSASKATYALARRVLPVDLLQA